MRGYQRSIGRKKAAALFNRRWWLGRPAREIAKFQLFTRELCMPFDVFHHALEEALGRPVWRHEFGFDVDGLIQEFLGERDMPRSDEILQLGPAEKREVLFVDEES